MEERSHIQILAVLMRERLGEPREGGSVSQMGSKSQKEASGVCRNAREGRFCRIEKKTTVTRCQGPSAAQTEGSGGANPSFLTKIQVLILRRWLPKSG
jgi:hypothetical protein